MKLLDPLAGLNTLQLLEIHIERNFGPNKIIGGPGENIFDYTSNRSPISLKEKDDYLNRLNNVLPKIEPIKPIRYDNLLPKIEPLIPLKEMYQRDYINLRPLDDIN